MLSSRAPQADAPATTPESTRPQPSTPESIAPDPVDLPLTWPITAEDPPLLFATSSPRRSRGSPAGWMVATAAAAGLTFAASHVLVTWQRQLKTPTAALTASAPPSRPNAAAP